MKTRFSRTTGRMFGFSVILACLFITGCVSTVPEGSAATKREALSFSPPKGKAGLYVLRVSAWPPALLYDVTLDEQDFGELMIQSYLFVQIPPGRHTIRMKQPASASLWDATTTSFNAEAGSNYFYSLKVVGSFTGSGIFTQMEELPGEDNVRKLKLSGISRFNIDETVETRKP